MPKSLWLAVAATVSWGLTTVLVKRLLSDFDPFTLLTVQLTSSCLVLWTIVIASKNKFLPFGKAVKTSLPGLLQPGLAFVLGTCGLSLTTASSDALLWATESLAIIGLSWLFLKEHVSSLLISLGICGMIGTTMATSVPIESDAGRSCLLGNALILVGVVSAAFHVILTKRQLAAVKPVYLFALHQVSALVLTIFAAIIYGMIGFTFHYQFNSPFPWLAASLTGVTQFALPFWLYITALTKIQAGRLSLLLNLPPIVTLAGSALFLGERLTLLQWVGACVAIVSVSGISLLRREAQ